MKLLLRKVQYAPESPGMAPSVETTKEFVMSEKPLHVKASLDKEVGYIFTLECFISNRKFRCWMLIQSVDKVSKAPFPRSSPV